MENDVIQKSFSEYEEYLRLLSFDATFEHRAAVEEIDQKKVKTFVHAAEVKCSFPFEEDTSFIKILMHLDLIIGEKKITNAALLLFGKNPQKFMTTSCIKCCQFYGKEVEKAIIYTKEVFFSW